jgi:hypothetical protein
MDDILIANYKDFESLDKNSRYELLSALIPGTNSKDCMKRAKLLKLKDGNVDDSKEISKSLISNF